MMSAEYFLLGPGRPGLERNFPTDTGSPMHKFSPASRRHPLDRAMPAPRSMNLRQAGAGRWALAGLLGCLALLALAPVAAAYGTGAITGTVTEASSPGTGIKGIGVTVVSESRGYAGGVVTGASGKYEVNGLTPGSYKVEFSSSGLNFVSQYYDEASSFSTATPVTLRAEGETQSEINAKLREGGEISGTVTGAGAGALEGVEVFVSNVAGNEEFFEGAHTNKNGEYTVMGLPVGSYKVEFFDPGINFVPQYYKNAASYPTATPVTIGAEGEARSSVGAELQVGGEISGTVIDAATHKPVAHAFVYASNALGEEFFGGYAETGANGEYTLTGLGTGSYNVEFTVFGAKGEAEYIVQSDNGVGVTAEHKTPGIDAALVRKEPFDTAAPVASGTPAVGQTLSCANGSWTGEPKPTFTDTWLRNGSAIAGATATTYVVQAADQGTGVACKVTATNKHGSTSAVSNTLIVPVPPPPPPPPSTPLVELPGSKLVVSGPSVRVPLLCVGATCTGTIELSGQVVVKHRKGRRTISKKRIVVLAKGSYSLAAGSSATIAVRLTAAGRSALAGAKGHKLPVKAVVTVTGGPAVKDSLVLSEAPPAKRRHKPKHTASSQGTRLIKSPSRL